ncbi:type II toxin-antitoxin system VapC family toxin [Massilia sp. MB5]|uniref:type II toxin-antitoxin system VapC family toxin n=1 Tax=Massilia sp. MB5 TaxID=2919578 RepID=UPI001F0EF6E0|nr:type II toxin-antitoxin system VapC family toxin [Massilia sp. MB5]UMR31460.1 type II toxin-antitoxin system VapC family toxin [Massilia sp. MB5]
MRVVDTSVWIEWLADTRLGRLLGPELPSRQQCLVPTIVQLELAKWLHRTAGSHAVRQMMRYTRQCVVRPLDTPTALRAANLHRQYGLALADAVIYATALRHNATLLTCDAHFALLPAVLYRSK